MIKKDFEKQKGGLYGLLIGDALGVPYEFYKPNLLPPKEEIEFTPPPDFQKSYPSVLPGTYSDDGAQALCLLDSLIKCKRFDLNDFANQLLDWYENGKWAVDHIVFDVGIQTNAALTAFKNGIPARKSGFIKPEGKGNGALMRSLPLALWHSGTEKELIHDAHLQCLVTHGNICNQVCCALYCLTARQLFYQNDFLSSYENALKQLRTVYKAMPAHQEELEWKIRPDDVFYGTGSGYVVDCLKSAFMIMKKASSYEDAVKQAVCLGNDTDTTACVTGGLAGILFGFENIPKRFVSNLRNKENIEKLLSCI